MEEVYETFKLIVNSDTPIDEERSELSVFVDSGKKESCRTNIIERSSNPPANPLGGLSHSIEKYVPVDIHPGQMKDISIKFNTDSLNNIFRKDANGNFMNDATSIIVRDKTKNIEFRIKLSDDLKGTYSLKLGEDLTTSRNFTVKDYSDQQMKLYEAKLVKNNQIPRMNHVGEIIWRVSNPRVGYSYRLIFSLKKIR